MFEINDKFFEEIGVNNMPENEREAFRNHIQEEVEARIGERISDGMPMERLEEFEQIIDGDINFIQSWVVANTPDYRNDNLFQAFLMQNNGQESPAVFTEYAGLKWLQINRPDFNQIIADVEAEIKEELRANISKIL